MGEKLMIRHAEYRDIPALVDLVMEFFANGELDGTGLYPDRDTIEFLTQDSIDDPARVLLISEIDGQVVGGIVGAIIPWVFNANILALMEMALSVQIPYRGKHGREVLALRRAFRQWGKNQGATVSVIASPARNNRSYPKMKHLDSTFVGRL